MNISLQSQMLFGDEQSLRDLFLVHRMAHDAYAKAIIGKGGPPMPTGGLSNEFALREWGSLMRGEDAGSAAILRDWLELHQNLHQAEYAAVGFGLLPDLVNVDFSQEGQFYDWMFGHTEIHNIIGQAVGVT